MSEQAYNPERDFAERVERYSQLTTEEVIELFNRDVGKPGWVAARGVMHAAIVRTLEDREIDTLGWCIDGVIPLRNTIRLNESGSIENIP